MVTASVHTLTPCVATAARGPGSSNAARERWRRSNRQTHPPDGVFGNAVVYKEVAVRSAWRETQERAKDMDELEQRVGRLSYSTELTAPPASAEYAGDDVPRSQHSVPRQATQCGLSSATY